jgi:hypothetical protein
MHNIIQDIPGFAISDIGEGGWVECRAGITQRCCHTMLELFGSFVLRVDEWYCHTFKLLLLVGLCVFKEDCLGLQGFFKGEKGGV